MIIQLKELIPMKTPIGDGYAIMFEGDGHDHYWTIALDNGAIVTLRQDQVRIANSYTHLRGINHAQMKKIVETKDDH
jgi:hypothetical protein